MKVYAYHSMRMKTFKLKIRCTKRPLGWSRKVDPSFLRAQGEGANTTMVNFSFCDGAFSGNIRAKLSEKFVLEWYLKKRFSIIHHERYDTSEMLSFLE